MTDKISLLDKWTVILRIVEHPETTAADVELAIAMLNKIDRKTGRIGEGRRKKLKIDDLVGLIGGKRQARAIRNSISRLAKTGFLEVRRRRGASVYHLHH